MTYRNCFLAFVLALLTPLFTGCEKKCDPGEIPAHISSAVPGLTALAETGRVCSQNLDHQIQLQYLDKSFPTVYRDARTVLEEKGWKEVDSNDSEHMVSGKFEHSDHPEVQVTATNANVELSGVRLMIRSKDKAAWKSKK